MGNFSRKLIDQLTLLFAVFKSWNNSRAKITVFKSYSHDLGTSKRSPRFLNSDQIVELESALLEILLVVKLNYLGILLTPKEEDVAGKAIRPIVLWFPGLQAYKAPLKTMLVF